jgi:phosphopantetheinyl transferase (holo-ACP synthase)
MTTLHPSIGSILLKRKNQNFEAGFCIMKEDYDKIADIKDFISRKEHDLVVKSGLPLHVGYALLWTMKESMSKILKTGLTITFNLLEIDTLNKTGLTVTGTFTNFTQYKAIASHRTTYVCSVTVPRQTDVDLNIFLESLARIC